MTEQPHSEQFVQKSSEQIISFIRDKRNDLIKFLLVNNSLVEYIENRHHVSGISAVKVEFAKRAIRELLIAPVDLEHYAKLIIAIKKDDDTVYPQSDETLFHQDIARAIKNYL